VISRRRMLDDACGSKSPCSSNPLPDRYSSPPSPDGILPAPDCVSPSRPSLPFELRLRNLFALFDELAVVVGAFRRIDQNCGKQERANQRLCGELLVGRNNGQTAGEETPPLQPAARASQQAGSFVSGSCRRASRAPLRFSSVGWSTQMRTRPSRSPVAPAVRCMPNSDAIGAPQTAFRLPSQLARTRRAFQQQAFAGQQIDEGEDFDLLIEPSLARSESSTSAQDLMRQHDGAAIAAGRARAIGRLRSYQTAVLLRSRRSYCPP